MSGSRSEVTMSASDPYEEEEITRAVARINSLLTGLILGLLGGTGLLVATLWLWFKGGPNPGFHLGLLGQYFPGYTVSFWGGFIGFAYAFAVCFVSGLLIGAVYNRLAR